MRVNFYSSDVPKGNHLLVKTNEEPISFFRYDCFFSEVDGNVPGVQQMLEITRRN